MANLTLTKAALINLLDSVLPNPDDPGPYGPIGPVMQRWLWVMLNPQPLPPKVAGPVPDPWLERFGLSLDPWRSSFAVRLVIDRIVAQVQFGEVLATGEPSQKMLEAARSQIREFVDDYCGTRPPKWPLPWPWPPKVNSKEVQPIELLLAGAQFQRAADAMRNNPLQSDFVAAADKLLQTGIERLEKQQETKA